MSHPIRATTAAAPGPRATIDEIRELLALIVVEHAVDVAERIDDRVARVAGRGVDATEHRTERGVVENRATECRGEITASVLDAVPDIAQPRLQLVDFADDRAFLRR